MEKWTNFFQNYRDVQIKGDPDLLYQVALTVGGKPISHEIFLQIVTGISRNLNLTHSDYLLDLCCGNGVITYELGKQVCNTTGIDSSKLYIENANKFKSSISIQYFEKDILEINKMNIINLYKFNKVLFYGSIAYFNKEELDSLLCKLYTITTADVTILIGNILDYSNRFKFYNTLTRKWHYFASVIFKKDRGLGNWWRKSDLMNISSRNGFNCTFLEQNPLLNTAHYRFDCILRKVNESKS